MALIIKYGLALIKNVSIVSVGNQFMKFISAISIWINSSWFINSREPPIENVSLVYREIVEILKQLW